MLKKLAWLGIIVAAAAAVGCLTGSGAVRGDNVMRSAELPAKAGPAGAGLSGVRGPAGSSIASPKSQ